MYQDSTERRVWAKLRDWFGRGTVDQVEPVETGVFRARLVDGGLAGDDLTPAARRVILRRIGFRVADEYDMPDPKDWDNPVRWPWVRLTNGVAVCLVDGIVSRASRWWAVKP